MYLLSITGVGIDVFKLLLCAWVMLYSISLFSNQIMEIFIVFWFFVYLFFVFLFNGFTCYFFIESGFAICQVLMWFRNNKTKCGSLRFYIYLVGLHFLTPQIRFSVTQWFCFTELFKIEWFHHFLAFQSKWSFYSRVQIEIF